MILSLFSWFFMLLLAIIFFQINVVLASGHCQSDQQELLLQLKSKLHFRSDVSLKLMKWNQSVDCCTWEGVTCDVRGLVTDLDLSDQWIFDGIDNSSCLFNLQHLRSLNLANNNFSSILPLGFAKLSNLRHLNLSNAGFSGQIPLEISRITSLVSLDLSVIVLPLSFFRGPSLILENPNLVMLVQNLKELKYLYLDGVDISSQGKEWCQAFSSLPNLQILSMSNCYLWGPIDSSLSKLQSLSVLRLDGNNLSAQFPEEIFQVCTLKTLNLSGNPLLEGSLKEFLPSSSLETLLLSDTSFGGTLPKSIGNLGRLSWIELANCHFNGSIPEAMANLTQLVSLDFSMNNFSGPFPSFSLAKDLTQLNLAHNHLIGSILSTEWSGLSKLVSIDLSNNSLNGALPTSLFGIPSLQSIVLSQNQFTGRLNDPPKLASSAFYSLELDSNRLAGPLPVFVFKLQSLRVLILSSNNFSGPLNISSFLDLKNLSILDLSFNNLSINATVSNPDSFPQIDILKLASCKLTRFPNFLKEQSKLKLLDLSHNQIDGEMPNWVWNIPYLTYLNLSHNFLVNLQESMRAPNSYLAILDLHGNKLQGQVPKIPIPYVDYSSNNFSSILLIDDFFRDVSFFSISNNNLHGTIYESICNFTSLQVLDLSNNFLNGTIPQCLTGMMYVLDLSGNNLSGNISDTFPSDCWIETLALNGNHLEGKIPRSLANCTNLEVLDLGNNQINDTFPCHLKNKSNLQVLVLSSNNFHGFIGCPNDNFSWPMLQIIDLASNHFKGELPHQWFRTWKAMMVDSIIPRVLVCEFSWDFSFSEGNQSEPGFIVTYHYQNSVTITNKGFERRLVKILSPYTFIDFSCNKFEGQIPEVLGELRALIGLNLSYNGFTGLIPSSLGNLKLLESLDLSNNNLSGEIPQQLGDLDFLEVLNLSHNQLQGRMPSGRHIQTFPEDSFKDNKGLCGFPLKENCSVNIVASSKDKYSDDRTRIDWNFLSVELGFVFGLGIVILPLLLCKRWRVWYYKRIDGLLSKFFPQLNQRSRNHGKGASRRTGTQLRNRTQLRNMQR
ncbi:hypothetical protein SLA2020_070600 [Shorea laevis]